MFDNIFPNLFLDSIFFVLYPLFLFRRMRSFVLYTVLRDNSVHLKILHILLSSCILVVIGSSVTMSCPGIFRLGVLAVK